MGRAGVNGGGVGLGSFSIEVPPLALSSATTFLVTETTIPPPVDYIDFSPIIVVAPHITTLSPAKITIRVSNRPDVPLTNLSIYAARDQYSPFARVADSNIQVGMARGSVTEFGAFFAGYPKSADQQNCP